MKKYYFNSMMYSIVYILIDISLIGLVIFCLLGDNYYNDVSFVITFLSIAIVFISFWIGFSLSMRIQIDFNKKELYIRHPSFIKKVRFEDVISIEFIDYSKAAFDFIITTKYGSKKIAYSKYYKRKITPKIQSNVNELKNDLLSITSQK